MRDGGLSDDLLARFHGDLLDFWLFKIDRRTDPSRHQLVLAISSTLVALHKRLLIESLHQVLPVGLIVEAKSLGLLNLALLVVDRDLMSVQLLL